MKRSWRIISFILTLIILLVSIDLSPFKMIVRASVNDYTDYWEDSVDGDLYTSMYVNDALEDVINGSLEFVDNAVLLEGVWRGASYEFDNIGALKGDTTDALIGSTVEAIHNVGDVDLASNLSFYQALFSDTTPAKFNPKHTDILTTLGFVLEGSSPNPTYNRKESDYIVSRVAGLKASNNYVFVTRAFINVKTCENYYAFLSISRDGGQKDPIGYGIFKSKELYIPMTPTNTGVSADADNISIYNDFIGRIKHAIVELSSDSDSLSTTDLDDMIEYVEDDIIDDDGVERTHYSLALKFHTFAIEGYNISDLDGYPTCLAIDVNKTNPDDTSSNFNHAVYFWLTGGTSLSYDLYGDSNLEDTYIPKASISNLQDSMTITSIDHDSLAKSTSFGDMYYTEAEIMFGDTLKEGASNIPEISDGLIGSENYSEPMAELSGNIIRSYLYYMINNADGNFFDGNGKPILPDSLFQTKAFKKIIENYLECLKKALEECTEAANEAAAANEWANLDEVMFDNEYDLMSSIVQQRVSYEFDSSKKFKGSSSGLTAYFQKVKIGNKRYYLSLGGSDFTWTTKVNQPSGFIAPTDGDLISVQDVWNKLNDYQKAIIAKNYMYRRSQLGITKSSYSVLQNVSELTKAGSATLPMGTVKVWTGVAEPTVVKGNETTDIVKATKDIIYQVDINPSWSTPMEYIQYTYELGVYSFYVGLYGQELSATAGLFEVYNADLSTGLNSANMNVCSKTYWMPISLPATIKALGNNTEAYYYMLDSEANTAGAVANNMNNTSGWNAFVNYLFQVSLGFEIAYSLETGNTAETTDFKEFGMPDEEVIGEGPAYGYSPSAMRDFLKDIAEDQKIDKKFDQGKAYMIKAVLGLYNIMNYLGIGQYDWTPAIAEYYQVALDCKIWEFANNPYIKNGLAANTSPEEPLGNFFSIESQQMTDSWRSGYALSATYVPFETNLYDATSVTHLDDTDWIADFYYKYGFYRKALYTSTDNQAVVNEYIAGKKSGKRLATLRDLLEYDRDIILYIDDNFYNADEIGDAVSLLDYSAMRSTATEQKMKEEELSEEEEKKSTKITDSLKEGMAELLNVEPDTLLKTGDTSYYSDDIAFKATKLGEDTTFLNGNVIDAYLLDEGTLLEAIGESEYSTKQSFAVVSAVYRDAELYNATLRTLVSDNAIFKSSPAVVNIPGATPDQYKHFLNYLMLAGLEDHMKNSATQILDLDAPIFCDLFGNIVTESGYVIIPAAANTTLTNKWTPCTLGFATLVGEQSIEIPEYSTDFREWFTGEYVTTTPDGTVSHLESATYIEHDKMSGWFMEGINGYRLKNSVLTSGSEAMTVDWSCLPKNSDTLKRIAYNKTYLENSTDMYSNKTLNLVMEVLRGAPIENIDYKKEGLDQRKGISSAGVYIAYKMEGFIDSITSTKDNDTGNSMVTMPNLAFVSGIEYIIMYVVKIAFALFILGLFISLYKEGVSGQLGIKSAFKFVGTILMIVVSIAFVPTLISWSYYESNKTLLKDEIGYIAMLNYTKEFDGAEVGITKVTTPESTTELYLKLQDISLDWWDIIDDVLVKNTFDTVTDMYVEQLEGIPIANEDGVIRKGSGLYYPVDRLLDDVVISYNSNRNQLQVKNYNEDGSVASYVTPYFAILQQLVTNVNAYNEANNIRSYSPSVSRTGHIVTYDVCSSYLLSDAFIADGYDILGLGEILDCNTSRPHFAASPFTDTDLELMQYSLWFPNKISDEITRENIKEVEDYARYWISKNKDMFGKIPDEVILKVFALQIATEFNDVFSIPAGQSLEILNIDSKDLTRLMIAERSDVYKYYAYNLARFSLETTGGFGSILTFLFVALQFILQVIKPIFMLLIIGLLLVNVIFRKLLFQKQSRCFEGYIITCACLCACNYAYSALLKLSMNVPDLFGNSIMSIIVAIAIQILYLGVLVIIIVVIKSDWKDMGYNSYAITATGIRGAIQDAVARTTGSFINGMSNILTRHGHGSGLTHSVRGGVHRGSNKGFRFKDVTVDSLHENEARHYARGRWDENPDDYED